MRATEFLDFLNKSKLQELNYSHFEPRNIDTGLIRKKYRKARLEYRKKNQRRNEMRHKRRARK